jgi:hypothetical protein
MTKKIVRLTESDLERIVRRVIEEQYAGVAFGAEQNGLRIKKIETTEQAAKRPVPQKRPVPIKKPEVIPPQMMGLTPVLLKVIDILQDKASQGQKNPFAVVPEDPKAIYRGVTYDDNGDKYITGLEKYVPILGEANHPFPKWVIQVSYTRGGSMPYTNRDGTVSQNAYYKWDAQPNQYDATRPDPKKVTESFDLLTRSYKINPDDFKKAIIAIYSDPKFQALLPKAKQIAQTTQTVPSFYKEVLSSLG